jgi:VRR-NUC domain
VTGAELMDAIVDGAHFAGWAVAHFAPARTSKGWRTPCRYDARGFPDLVLVRDRVVFAEVKGDGDRLRAEQAAWIAWLTKAGAEVYVWGSGEWTDGTVDAVLGLKGRT